MSSTIVVGSKIILPREASHELTNKIKGILSWTNPSVGFKQSRGWWVDPKEERIIKGYSQSSKSLFLPRGFLERMELLLQHSGVKYKIEDRRVWYKPRPYKNNIKMFAHQVRPIKEMLPYDEGILEAPCGSGKSVMALKMICEWGQPTLVLAHTNAIIEQWQEYVEQFTGMKAGLIHGNTYDIQPITIGSVMTLVNRDLDSDFRRYFGAVILDEAHHTPAYSFQSVLSRFAARKRIGITATPRRSDGLQGYLEAVAGPVRTRVNPESLFVTGFAIRPTIYKVKTNFRIEEEFENNDVALFGAIEADEDRASLVADVLYQNRQRSVLGLSRRIDHLDLIHETLFELDPSMALGAKVLTGRLKSEERARILRRTRKGKLHIVLATQLADEGLDIPILDTLLLTFPASSELKIEQQIGRVMRSYEGKEDVRVYDFIDDKVPRLMKQAQKRIAHYRHLKYPIATLTVV